MAWARLGSRATIGAWSIDRGDDNQQRARLVGSIDDARVYGRLREDMEAFGTQSILMIPDLARRAALASSTSTRASGTPFPTRSR